MLVAFETRFEDDWPDRTVCGVVRVAAPEATLVLMQDAVRLAIAPAPALEDLARHGVRVLVDDFSLALRDIDAGRLSPVAQVVDADGIVAALARERVRALWH